MASHAHCFTACLLDTTPISQVLGNAEIPGVTWINPMERMDTLGLMLGSEHKPVYVPVAPIPPGKRRAKNPVMEGTHIEVYSKEAVEKLLLLLDLAPRVNLEGTKARKLHGDAFTGGRSWGHPGYYDESECLGLVRLLGSALLGNGSLVQVNTRRPPTSISLTPNNKEAQDGR